jgi:hypothetical protein
MTIKEIFTKRFLFDVNPVMIENIDKMFGVAGAVMVILAAIFKMAAVFAPTPVDKRVRNRFFSMFLTIGLLELIWYGLRYQNVTVLGSHFTAMLIFAIGLVWLGFIIKDIWNNYKSEKQNWEKEQVRQRYLPQ